MDLSCKPNIYVSRSSSELRLRLARRGTSLSPPVKYFTERSKAVLLLWIICVIYVLCLSCFCVCSLLRCGLLKGKAGLLALVVTFIVVLLRSHLGQVWYLIISISDPFCLSYLNTN